MKLLTCLSPLLLGGFFWVKNSTPSISNPPVEICDNGIDDDNDGLIDLNDTTDCKCPLVIPVSLIPNPSFEDKNCCPQDKSELDCATGWIQASEATTDFLHTCGWMGWPDLPPPVPFPDGEGCVGFRNGRISGPSNPGGHGGPEGENSNWKEYAGACLTSPLKAGTAYRFEFWVGFTYAFNSPPTDLVFYGSTDCTHLPFGIGDETFGCPTNGPGWMELGSLPISGAFEWKKMEINVTPTEDIYSICIGPNCDTEPLFAHTYYFFDNLVLAELSQFELRINPTGNPCDKNSFALNLPDLDTLQYQWYRDGIALVGETGPSLLGVADLEGNYQVRMIGPNSCKTTSAYSLKIPTYETFVDSVICKSESVFFDNSTLHDPGQYLANLKSWQGCDSTVHLKLRVTDNEVDTVFAQIFKSETYHLGQYSFNKEGEYDAIFPSYLGCDSLVHVILDFYDLYIPNAISPNNDGINDVFNVFSGDDVLMVSNLAVFDRWGGRIYNRGHIQPNDVQAGWDGTRSGKPATSGVYVWQATIIFQDGKKREFTGEVTLVR